MQYDILLIGGNGFVGRVLAAQLQLAGYSVLIPTSHPSAGRELRMLPKLYIEWAIFTSLMSCNLYAQGLSQMVQ
jgi:NADH dehydrogenase